MHEVDADEQGLPVVRSVPSASAHRDDAPYADADEATELKRHAPRDPNDNIDKTGRPAWFAQMSLDTLRPELRKPLMAAGAAGLLLLLFGVFYFALGPSAPDAPNARPTHAVASADGEMRPTFGTNIGFPGPYATGAPPEYAQDMQPASKTRGVSPIQTSIPGYGSQFNPFRHMGPLTPYYAADFGVDNGRYLTPPQTANGSCTLTQVHILHRHGARYPTSGAPPELVRDLLQGGQAKFTGPLAFLNAYTYRLGTELLVPLGREQLHRSGVKAAMDYGALAARDLAQHKKLFVRAGSQQRIVDSALAWSTGFWGNAWPNHTDFEVQIEAPHFNTTLAPNFACRAAAESFRVRDYVDHYLASATARLQGFVHGAKLTPMHLFGMQQLCAYDTVAFGHSAFCALFSEEEWRGFEYAWDQRFYYDYGPGAATGAAMGLGWVNEMVSRLTHTPWNRATQTSENATFNTDPTLFPVDRALYADFTHDSVLTSVLATLGLRELGKPPRVEDEQRAFRTSHVVPFSARLVLEKFVCGAEEDHALLRLKLNDAIVPLAQLAPCLPRADGLCSQKDFLAGLAQRNHKGWWEKCNS